ncbi:MAG: S26 family signal peptidase [Vicingaceae bacterium]|nr:S26 family signal peptidase [Vicingaceae bacterium]
MKTSSKILLAVGIILTAFLIYYQSRFQHFKIATTSMHISFCKGDVLMFDKHYDMIKTNTILAFNTPFIDGVVCSRVVGCPNDTIEIIDGILTVNSKVINYKNTQYEYNIVGEEELKESLLMKRNLMLEPFSFKDQYGNYRAYLNDDNAKKIKEIKGVTKVEKVIHPKGYEFLSSEIAIFPNHKNYNWSRDNFGGVTIPKMGVKIELKNENLPLYIELIKQETGSSETEIEQLKNYTFKENYYFMMSDNRHNAIDSRHFGFVPESEIIGVYSSVIYSSK